jgi:hypothetical protein
MNDCRLRIAGKQDSAYGRLRPQNYCSATIRPLLTCPSPLSQRKAASKKTAAADNLRCRNRKRRSSKADSDTDSRSRTAIFMPAGAATRHVLLVRSAGAVWGGRNKSLSTLCWLRQVSGSPEPGAASLSVFPLPFRDLPSLRIAPEFCVDRL